MLLGTATVLAADEEAGTGRAVVDVRGGQQDAEGAEALRDLTTAPRPEITAENGLGVAGVPADLRADPAAHTQAHTQVIPPGRFPAGVPTDLPDDANATVMVRPRRGRRGMGGSKELGEPPQSGLDPVQPVQPVQPVEPVEPVEPVQQAGRQDDEGSFPAIDRGLPSAVATVDHREVDEPESPFPSPPADPVEPQPPTSRAGRNLTAAIAVGVGLGGAVAASLFLRKEAFVALASAAIVLGVWELAGALRTRKIAIPVVPLGVGSVGMLVSAFVSGEEGLLVAFALTTFGAMLWRIIDGLTDAVRDVAAAVFTVAYVPFLAGFAMLMLAERDGVGRIVVLILLAVANDVGGYVTGVLAGRHPMAPSVSPKKSWEGFAGSLVTGMVTGAVSVTLLLDGPWWAGVAVGAVAVVTATVGDLSESLIKRDLGIKDMGNLLPGHGGIMDRLDSLLPTAPAVYLLLTLLVAAA
jgi:phosphatidate cytidylyltransferase